MDINHSCLQNWTGTYGGTGNHGMDPLFEDADGLDDITGTEDDNLKLSGGSPSINSGDYSALPTDAHDLDNDGNTSELIPIDIEGKERIINKVDEGAYEFVQGGPPWRMKKYHRDPQ
jgi:hypothetical protein